MRATALAFVVVCAVSGSAQAETTPWSKDVPQERQDRANKLFAEGNQLFAQQAHAPALEKYRAALEIWDHPLIRFNAAVTLIRLERPLEASEQLEKALVYAEQPFESKQLYQSALDYQALLKSLVGHIEVSCTQSGARILLDGKQWFSCPGTQKARVDVGEHVVVGEHPELLPTSRRLVVRGGAVSSEKIELVPLESVVKLEYPTQRWIPWTVAGAGVAIAIGGLGFWLSGRSQMDDFERNFASECSSGCEADLSQHNALRDQRDSAERKGTIGISMMIAGGAATVGGVVWTILNRPRRVMPSVEVAPTAGGMAASAHWRF